MYVTENKKNWRVLLGFLFITATLVANPLSDLKNLLNGAKDRLNSAKSELSSARSKLSGLESKLSSARASLSELKEKLQNEKTKLGNVRSLISSVNGQISNAKSSLSSLQTKLSESKALVTTLQNEKTAIMNKIDQLNSQYRAILDHALNTKILAYSVTTEGKMSYNFKTGTFFGQVDIGNGFTMDSKKIEDWMSGTVAIPRGNPVQFAVSAASLQQMQHDTQYFNRRNNFFSQTAGTHGYYASQRFVEWASAETAAHHVILGIASAGSTVNQSIREAQDQLLLEFSDVVAFLMESGIDDVERAATCALSSILGESCPSSIGFQIGTRLEGVSCTYKGKSNWITGIPSKFLPGLTLPSLHASVNSSHVGFGLNWSTNYTSVSSLRERIERFSTSPTLQLETERLFKIAIQKLLGANSAKAQKYLANFNYAQVSSGLTGLQNIANLMRNSGVNVNQLLSRFQEGNPIIDLRGTPVSNYLEQRLSPLAQGNEGKASITRLEFDLSHMTINVTVDLLHRQSWGRLEDAAEALNDWYRSKSNSLRIGAMDLINSAARSTLDALTNKYNTLSSSLTATASKITAASAKVAEALSKVTSATNTLNALKTKLNGLIGQESTLVDSYNSLVSKVNAMVAKVNNLVDLRNAAANEVNRLVDKVNSIANEVSNLEEKIRNFVPSIPGGPHWPF